MKLSELSGPLGEALERMRQIPELLRPFVIVDSVATGQFVQFCGGEGRSLLFDMPRGQLGSDDTAAQRLLSDAVLRSWLPDRETSSATMSYSLIVDTVPQAAELALKVLREVHQLADDAELSIIEDADFKGKA